MSKLLSALLPLCMYAAVACKPSTTKTATTETTKTTTENTTAATAISGKPIASNAVIMGRKQVPVICYHQIRDWRPTDSKTAKDYIIPVAAFKQHIKMLADSGYHTILPDQLYNYLAYGAPLPSKPIMLTFDDTDLDQFTIARPELKKYGFKGVYFIMTVSIGRPHYMSKEQIKQLADEGNAVESHTWDHHMFSKFSHNSVFKIKGKNGQIINKPSDDWVMQIDKPTAKLKEITGKEIKYFAYPFGIWNEKGLPELHKRGFVMAFQLADKRDPNDPLMTVRRILDSGYWSTKTFSNSVRHSF